MYKSFNKKKYTFVLTMMLMSICVLFVNSCSTVEIIPIVVPTNTMSPTIAPTNTVSPTYVFPTQLLPDPLSIDEFCPASCQITSVGNGVCDSVCNNEICEYDGGDCE